MAGVNIVESKTKRIDVINDDEPCPKRLANHSADEDVVNVQEPPPKTTKIDPVSPESNPNLELCSNNNGVLLNSQIRNDPDEPIISITFKNEEVSRRYKGKFCGFLNKFVDFILNDNGLKLDVCFDDGLNPNEWVVVSDGGTDTPPSKETTPKKHKKKKKKFKDDSELFVLDTKPSVSTHKLSLQYESKFTIISTAENVTETASKTRKPQSCFNCDGDHNMKDCKEPMNYGKVRAARMNFRAQQNKSLRYHLEDEQKYGYLEPGNISDSLREALGISKNELPDYIYRMRYLGYPPGWLEEAKTTESELTLFDFDGKGVSSFDKSLSSFNTDKVVDYPGFNVPMERGCRDDYRRHNCQPYSKDLSKEAMIEYIKNMERGSGDCEQCDMDVEDNSQILSCVMNDTSRLQEESVATTMSPTLLELESQKEELLAEIGEDNSALETSDICRTTPELPPEAETGDGAETPTEVKNVIKTSSFGTPIIKSASPYSKLPRQENFSQNISQVINFENLPNSVGKYEQMTDLLQKVRKTMQDLKNPQSPAT